jgi:SAM-dependent methyltransferase
MSYDQRFYDVIRSGARLSARTAVPVIAEQLGLRPDARVLDVGCGEGWWADAFAAYGCQVTGIDSGTTVDRPATFTFIDQSLDEPLPDGRWDLIICLEVLEHVRPGVDATVIAQIATLTDCCLISAARPGQGGTGHINEQPISYWAGLMSAAGFAVSGALRWHLWGNELIENWYQQNLLVGVPASTDADEFLGQQLFPPVVPDQMAYPHDVVHPTLFDARRRP